MMVAEAMAEQAVEDRIKRTKKEMERLSKAEKVEKAIDEALAQGG
jgi:UDP:flavonoid glycosyltransferase YjiC (YdhE family)